MLLQTFKTLVVKMVGAMFSIGCGLVAGKEGPFIQCGACIAALALQVTTHARNWLDSHKQATTHASGAVASSEQPLGDAAPAAATASSNDVLQDGCATSNTKPAGANSTRSIQRTPREQQQQQHSFNGSGYVQLGLPHSSATHHTWQQYEEQQQFKQLQHHQVAMGAGAGVAAAFISPLAGAAYSVEEATTTYSGTLLTQVGCHAEQIHTHTHFVLGVVAPLAERKHCQGLVSGSRQQRRRKVVAARLQLQLHC
jgi:hypothetical protein